MTLFFRSIQCIIRACFQPRLKRIDEPVSVTFRVTPNDLDIARHMNNAVYLNYLEAVRWAFLKRSGILRMSVKEGWMLPISKIEIQYLRQLKLWQKFTVTVQVVRTETKWTYVYHEIFSGEKMIARAMLRGTVRRGRETVSGEELVAKLNYKPAEGRADINAWLDKFAQD